MLTCYPQNKVTFLAILAARAVALPLSPPFPAPELQYILSQSRASLLLHSPRYAEKVKEVLSIPFPVPSPNPAPELKPLPTVFELPKHLGTRLGSSSSSSSYEKVLLLEEDDAEAAAAAADQRGAGMMLYTSGTTNRPKGVLLPLSALTAQCRSLIEAWEYSPADRLLHVLPLHHIHGTVNALLTPLFAGSSVEFLFPFNADTVWRRFALPFLPETSVSVSASAPAHANGIQPNGTGASAHADAAAEQQQQKQEQQQQQQQQQPPRRPQHDEITAGMSRAKITFFTVVPTVYTRLLGAHAQLARQQQKQQKQQQQQQQQQQSGKSDGLYDLAEAARTAVSPAHLRVSISGSAALPAPLKRAWRDLSRGAVLLERYGMTEVGMALSCGLHPADRVDGSVGWPLPGVEARLVDLDTGAVIPPGEGEGEGEGECEGEKKKERAGEIQLRGPNIFREYWDNPAATAREFVPADPGDPNQGRWFRTGDVAVRRRPPPPPPPPRGAVNPDTDTTSTTTTTTTTTTEKEDRPDGGAAGAGEGRSGAWARGPMWYILGRLSADIIKSGGEKVSALEVERELLSLAEVAEAAVVAVPSGRWGQKVGAVVVMTVEGEGQGQGARAGGWRPMDMRRALRGRLAAYKIPQVLRVVAAIDRNAMGKVNKKDLVRRVFLDDFSGDEM